MSDREKSQEAEGSGNYAGGRSGSRTSRKRKHEQLKVDQHSKRRRSRSSSSGSYRHRYYKHSRKGRKSHKSRYKDDRDYKINEIFNWMRDSRHSRHRSRDRSYSRYSSRSSGSSRNRRKSISETRTQSRDRPLHDISFDSHSVRSVVVPLDAQAHSKGDSNQSQIVDNQPDPLTARLNALRAEGLPKPDSGPPISEDLAPVLNGFLAKSEFVKTMKLCEKYPRPSNIDHLSILELPKDANKIIDHKAVKNDERFINDQKCTTALFGALSRSLDSVLKLKDKVPELMEVGDMLLDGLQMTGFLHQDFTTIRLKGFKQTVNPSYGEVVTQKPEEPGTLLGKTPIGEQMKSCDDK